MNPRHNNHDINRFAAILQVIQAAPGKNRAGLLGRHSLNITKSEQCFTAHMPLLMATSALELGSRYYRVLFSNVI